MAEFIIARAGDPTRRFALEREEIVIGSDLSCDVILDSRFVSRRHAELRRKGASFEIRDAGSRNGTFLNGKKLNQTERLKHRDEIVLADFFLTFWETDPHVATEPFDVRLPEKLSVDTRAREVWCGPSKLTVRLSANEFRLLAFLYENRGRVCSNDEIGDHVWGFEIVGEKKLARYTDNMIQRLVFLLRSKLRKAGATQEYVVNVPGAGYRLDDSPST